MKIYTKTGDLGGTSLFGGRRVKKNNPRLNAYGSIDELNAHLGVVISLLNSQNEKKLLETRDSLIEIQIELFNIGSHLACDKKKLLAKLPKLNPQLTSALEKKIDKMDSQLNPLKNFILPGGHMLAAHTHVARTVARRSERCVVELSSKNKVDPQIVIFLNRLSDYLFVLSRYYNFYFNVTETAWISK